MSEIRVNNITNRDGTAGPSIAGIPVVDSNSHFVVPTGRTGQRYVDGGENIVRDGLVLHLDAKYSYPGATGTNPDVYTWYDMSGNGGNAELVGGVSYSTSGGGSLFFDGTNTAAFLQKNHQIINPTTNLTISQWLKRTTNDSAIRDSLNLRSTSNEVYFILFRGDITPKRWQFGYRTPSTNYAEPMIEGKFLDLNVWYNMTYIIDSNIGDSLIYVNGELQSVDINADESKTFGTNIISDPNARLNIGVDENIGRRWLGNIATTYIYNRALTASEVLQNYNATKSRFQ